MNRRTPGVARRSRSGNPGCLLRPATPRATIVQRFAARFRAWRTAAGKSRRDAPAGGRREPWPPRDEVSTSASGARTGLSGRVRGSVPA